MDYILASLCDPFTTVPVKSEHIHKYWYDRGFFFCTVMISDSGELIFSEMNPTYTDLIGHSANNCKGPVNEAACSSFCKHIRKMSEHYKGRKTVIQYLFYSRSKETYWKVTAVLDDKVIDLIGQRSDMNTFVSDEKYLGTMIVRCEGEKYIIDTCSDILRKTVSHVTPGNDLSAAAGKYLSGVRSLNIISACISKHESFDFYDIARLSKDMFRAVHLNIMPLAVGEKHCAAIGISVLSDISCDVDYCFDQVAYAVVDIRDGSYCFCNTDPALDRIISEKRLSDNEIFAAMEQSLRDNRNIEIAGRYNSRFIVNAARSMNSSNIMLRMISVIDEEENCDKKTLYLTDREEEMLFMAASGMNNIEIGKYYGISKHTVSETLTRVFRKLGITSRIGLVQYLGEHGMFKDGI